LGTLRGGSREVRNGRVPNPYEGCMTASQVNMAVLVGLMIGLSLGSVWLVMWAMGFVTGWRKLAAQFPAREPLANAASAFGSIGFHSLGNYNNCVRFRMDEECLHVRMIPLFEKSHPPMSVPWEAVEVVDEKAGWGGFCRVKIAGVPVRVPRKVIARELELRRELEGLRAPA